MRTISIAPFEEPASREPPGTVILVGALCCDENVPLALLNVFRNPSARALPPEEAVGLDWVAGDFWPEWFVDGRRLEVSE